MNCVGRRKCNIFQDSSELMKLIFVSGGGNGKLFKYLIGSCWPMTNSTANKLMAFKLR